MMYGYTSSHSSLPLSDLSSVPDPEWLPELDWLPAEEGGASRPLSSSLLWVRSPPSELLSESLRAERDEEVLLVSLRGLLEFRPGHKRTESKKSKKKIPFSLPQENCAVLCQNQEAWTVWCSG